MPIGHKIGALRLCCSTKLTSTHKIPEKVKNLFKFPIIEKDVFDLLDKFVIKRNIFSHSLEIAGFQAIRRLGQETLSIASEIINKIADNKLTPRIVQITSLQYEIYGRHFYFGRDDRGRNERIFFPYPLDVGELYLLFPLTNPARINPLLFPFDYKKKQ